MQPPQSFHSGTKEPKCQLPEYEHTLNGTFDFHKNIICVPQGKKQKLK